MTFTLVMRIWPSIWVNQLVFKLVNFNHMTYYLLWEFDFYYDLIRWFLTFSHITCSCFENPVIIMTMLVFNLVNLIIWLTVALRIWSSLWLFSSIFNLMNLIIWTTLALRIWSSLWLYSSVFILMNLIIWPTLALRIWLSIWLYSSVFNLMNLIKWLTLTLRI